MPYLQEIEISSNSVFARHGYLQYAGTEWKVHHALRYRIYFKRVDYSLKDAVKFAYGDRLNFNQYAKSGKVRTLATGASVNNGKNVSEEFDIEKLTLKVSEMSNA